MLNLLASFSLDCLKNFLFLLLLGSYFLSISKWINLGNMNHSILIASFMNVLHWWFFDASYILPSPQLHWLFEVPDGILFNFVSVDLHKELRRLNHFLAFNFFISGVIISHLYIIVHLNFFKDKRLLLNLLFHF